MAFANGYVLYRDDSATDPNGRGGYAGGEEEVAC